MKALIFTDLHIDEKSLEECKIVLGEILGIAWEYEVDVIWNLGDTFDNYRPSSDCMDVYANFVKRWGGEILNIVASSHESTQIGKSILNHYSILSENYHIEYGEYETCGYLLGHYMVDESLFGYKVKRKVADLKKYKHVFLGHQHTPQEMGNVTHVGSCRYISFSEYSDIKRVLILDLDTNEIEEIILQLVIPMAVYSCDKNTNKTLYRRLKVLEPDTKVKVIFNDLEGYKFNINNISEWNEKFIDFKVELNFKVNGTESKETKTDTFSNDFLKWLDENDIDEDIKNILRKEVENVK